MDFICQNIIIHYKSISNICNLRIRDTKAQMVVNFQGILIVLVAGKPDFMKSPLFTKFCKKIQSFRCQMPSSEGLMNIQFAQKKAVIFLMNARISGKLSLTENFKIFITFLADLIF